MLMFTDFFTLVLEIFLKQNRNKHQRQANGAATAIPISTVIPQGIQQKHATVLRWLSFVFQGPEP